MADAARRAGDPDCRAGPDAGRGRRFVKPRGRIVYVTCSLLREENEDRIAAFLGTHADYKSLPVREMVELAQLPELERFASRFGFGLRLTPLTSGTDGFFIAMLMRG